MLELHKEFIQMSNIINIPTLLIIYLLNTLKTYRNSYTLRYCSDL